MVNARRAPVVRASPAIAARLRVVARARGHLALTPRHLSKRRTPITAVWGSCWPCVYLVAIDDAADLMVMAQRAPAVRTSPAISARLSVVKRARDHSAPLGPNYLWTKNWSQNTDDDCGRSARPLRKLGAALYSQRSSGRDSALKRPVCHHYHNGRHI
ncbi:hypothetical protein T492DRAFT_1077059 [Pavlovales sp. CCMP2436]|nr:hypothetical protein T492DRAFT_1077059 [Pavlovales sp. CCMP2436]